MPCYILQDSQPNTVCANFLVHNSVAITRLSQGHSKLVHDLVFVTSGFFGGRGGGGGVQSRIHTYFWIWIYYFCLFWVFVYHFMGGFFYLRWFGFFSFSFFACLLGVLCCFGFSIFALQIEKSCKASIQNIVTFP